MDRVAQVLELEPVRVERARARSARPRRRGAARSPACWQCHGSSRKSEPSVPIASSSSRSGRHVPQSKSARTSPGKRIEPAKTQSVPLGPTYAWPSTRLGLAREEPRSAHAVAADVHQAAALDVGAQADVVRVVERVAEGRADDAQLADRAVRGRARRARFVCGLWRYMNASVSRRPAALGRVERLLDVGRVPAQRLLAEDVLARLERPDRPLAVHRVRERDVDGVDVGVLEQRLVGAVRPLDAPTRARTRRPCPGRGSRRRSARPCPTPCAPGITFRLMSAVETMPSRVSPMTAPSSAAGPSRGCGDCAGA